MAPLHPKIAKIVLAMDPKVRPRKAVKDNALPWKNMEPFSTFHLASGQVNSLSTYTQDFTQKPIDRTVNLTGLSLLNQAEADQFNFIKPFCDEQDWGPIYRA